MAASAFFIEHAFSGDQLAAILVSRSITTRFQPIVNLKTGQTLGYEALSRGPENSVLFVQIQIHQADLIAERMAGGSKAPVGDPAAVQGAVHKC